MAAKLKLSVEERLVIRMRERFSSEDVALIMTEGGFARVTDVCPTGIEVLDRHVIGVGGVPYGQITEIIGVESAGKTTLLAKIMGSAQRVDDAVVAFADAETSFDEKWGVLHGLDPARLIQFQPETLEDFQEQADFLVASRPKNRKFMLALDSIASLPTRNEMNTDPKDVPAEHARVWTHWGRQFKMRVAMERDVAVVWVNQPRSKIGVAYGPSETSFGGRWLRHAPALRLYVSHGKTVKEEGQHAARFMHVRAEKNKLAPPHRSCQLRLDYREGFDDDWATLNHAKEVGCIEDKAPYTAKSVRQARAALGWPLDVEAVPRAIPGPEEADPAMCAHANENPNECSCPPDCYCRSHTCKDRR